MGAQRSSDNDQTDESRGGAEFPSGTLTFMFTDIEASTERWELRPETMRDALAIHDQMLTDAISANGGLVFKHTGDGLGAVFTSASAAVQAALAAQSVLQGASWPEADRLKVRMGIHAGDAVASGGDYVGATVNRSARLSDLANGDQITVSAPILALVPGIDVMPQGEHQLRGIGSEEVWLLRSPDLIDDRRPLRARVLSKGHDVPRQPSKIVGRSAEVESIAALLSAHRLVTITGPGGVGKTRLAIEVAHAVSDRFAHVPAYCELAQLTDEDSVAEVVAQAIGARRQPGMDLRESIVNFLGGRSVLVVLDNCEHLVPSVRSIVAQILAVPGPSALATSRQPIAGAPSEQLFPLEPLDAATDGLQLFAQRAHERDPHFAITDQNRRDLERVCDRLDGIPGAIELAAARVRVLSPAQLLDRLDDRFRLLRGRGDTDRTLLETVRWSYDQLEPAEAHLFEQLSVFAGSFSLEAVEMVGRVASGQGGPGQGGDAVEVIDLLMGLVDKSMLASERGVGQVRFRMLETMRAFGAAQLIVRGEADEVRSRHVDYFAELAGVQSAKLMSSGEADVWHQLGQDWSNLRSAFETLRVTADDERCIDLVLNLSWFATFAMRFEVFVWAEALAAEPRLAGHARYPALLGACALGAYFVVDPKAGDVAQQALVIDPAETTGLARGALGAIYLNNLHSLADSDRTTREWIETLGGPDSTTENRLWALAMRTFHLALNLEADAAILADEVLALANELGSASAIGIGRWAQGLALVAQGQLDRATEIWEQGIDTVESLSSQHLVGHMLNGLLAHWKVQIEEIAIVVPFCRDLLQQAIDQHYLAGASHLFGVTAIVLSRAGQPDVGAALLGAMQANGHVPRPPARQVLRDELGEGFEGAAAVGEEWTIKHAGNVALAALDSVASIKTITGDSADE